MADGDILVGGGSRCLGTASGGSDDLSGLSNLSGAARERCRNEDRLLAIDLDILNLSANSRAPCSQHAVC